MNPEGLQAQCDFEMSQRKLEYFKRNVAKPLVIRDDILRCKTQSRKVNLELWQPEKACAKCLSLSKFLKDQNFRINETAAP